MTDTQQVVPSARSAGRGFHAYSAKHLDMLTARAGLAPDERLAVRAVAAVLSGSPDGVPTGDDASLFVSFSEQCLCSAPIMALARNPVWRGPQRGPRRASEPAGTERAPGR